VVLPFLGNPSSVCPRGEEADETAIVVAGKDANGHGYVLADQSGRHPPTEWARTRDADDEGVGVKEVRGTTPCTQKKILLALAQVSQGRAR
jgi:hypothetical protein